MVELDPETVRDAVRDWDPWVRHALAERSDGFGDLAPEIVSRLLRDEDLMVVGAAVRCAPLSARQLDELASHSELVIRRSLAHRDAELPVPLLERLAADPDSVVREFVARRADIGAALREVLAVDERWNVRAAATAGPAGSTVPEVQASPELSHLLSQLGPQTDRVGHAEIAGHPGDLPRDVVMQLCHDEDPVVRIRIAFRPGPLDVEALELLSRDVNAEVRLTVAERGDLSSAIREALMMDPDPLVKAAAAANS